MQLFQDDEENQPTGAPGFTQRSEQPSPPMQAPMAAPAPAEAPPLTLKDLMAKEDSNTKTKGYLSALGGIAQNFADIPSSHELLWGGKGHHSDIKGMIKGVTDTMTDPLDRESKAMAYMKAKREDNAGGATENFKNSLSDENGKAAKAFKQTLISAGGDPEAINGSTASDLYAQGYSPAKMAEIKAKSNVEFGDKAKLFEMEQAERTKDKKDLKAMGQKDKSDSDYQKLVQATEQHASSLRGDDAAKLSSAKLSAIASGRALLKQYEGREDEMTPDQLSILAADRVKAVTGGVPTNEEMKDMMPHNMGTKWAGTKSYFTGSPEAANSGGWVKEAERDFQVQEKAARDILKNRQDQITSNPRLKPEDKERISRMAVPPEALSLPERPTKVINGITYQKVPGGWQQITSVGQK